VNAVRPGLEQADTALATQAEAALDEWLAWAAQVALVFMNDPPGTSQCGTLQNECDQAHGLATSAVAAHAQQRLNNCNGNVLTAQLRDILHTAIAGAIDLTGSGRQTPPTVP
jgi:hypothetical protein